VFLAGRKETLELKLELKWIAAAALLMAAAIGGVSSTRAETPEVSLPPFYKSATTFSPKGKLGEVLVRRLPGAVLFCCLPIAAA
jgi:hypothetical protein